MNEIEKMANNLKKLESIKGSLPADFLAKVVAHPTVQELIKKNNQANSSIDSFSFGWSLTPARITQKEAMQYVNIGTWESFENWIEKNGVAFSYNGNRKLFRKSELDKAILLDEERAKLLLQQ